MAADPLAFLNIDDPMVRRNQASSLAGQKAGLMEKYTKPKTSVGAAAVQGAIGGAIAGASMMASAGAFNGASGASGADPMGNRTAPTVEDKPFESGFDESGAMASAKGQQDTGIVSSSPSGDMYPGQSQKLMAGGKPADEYNKRYGNKSSAGIMAFFMG